MLLGVFSRRAWLDGILLLVFADIGEPHSMKASQAVVNMLVLPPLNLRGQLWGQVKGYCSSVAQSSTVALPPVSLLYGPNT
jgi:hypothetical protein